MSILSFALLIALFSVSVMGDYSKITGGENQKALEKFYSAWREGKNGHACGNRLNYALWRKCPKKYPLSLNGGASDWSSLDRCTTCGANINYNRARTCTRPIPKGTGSTCLVPLFESLKCGMEGFCKEIPANHLLTTTNHRKDMKSLTRCMKWCQDTLKDKCGFVAYGVKGEIKENWCLIFTKTQRAKGCTPTYAAAVQKKADLDIEYNIHFNDHNCDQMYYEHNTCGHIKDGVGHCITWDKMHVAGPYYDIHNEASCRKKCEETKDCGVFILGKLKGNIAGTCDLFEKNAARICKATTAQKENWKMYSKNKCEDEAVMKWGPSRSDGKCGAKFNADCKSGRCCSKYGWCGTSAAYCNGGTSFKSDAPMDIELLDEPNEFEINEGKSALDTYLKSADKEEDDTSGKDEDDEEESPVKSMKDSDESDVLTARTQASQFLHSRKRRGITHECCKETCDKHEIWELCD